MIITPSNLDALFISFSKQFEDAYFTEPSPLVDAIGSKVPSNTRDQRYPFVQTLSAAMREWKGERRLQNVVLDGFVVTNKRWEDSLAIQRIDLEFDQYNAYSSMLIPNLARAAKLLPDQQIAAEISANNTGFDGVSFFSASHPIDPSGFTSGTQSNILTTSALSSTNLAKAQAQMMGFVGPDGYPMGSYGDTLLVPPSLKYVADTLANATFYPGASNSSSSVFSAVSNVWQGQFRVVCSPYLADTGNPATAVWYLLDCRNPRLRPYFWQEFQAPQLVSVVDPASYSVFMKDEFFMGARAIGASASALWFKALKVTT